MKCYDCGHSVEGEHERKYVKEEDWTELWCHAIGCTCWTWAEGKYPNLRFEPRDGIQHPLPNDFRQRISHAPPNAD